MATNENNNNTNVDKMTMKWMYGVQDEIIKVAEWKLSILTASQQQKLTTKYAVDNKEN